MPRKASGIPKERPPRPLSIAEHLPADPVELNVHCAAGWTAMKADAQHFPSPPATAEMDTALTALDAALKAQPNGSHAQTAAVTAAATTVRGLWTLNSAYAQKVLRTLPVEQVPPILANVLLYQSQRGKKGSKPPIAAKHGPNSGTVLVTVLAIAQALSYAFEWSADQTTWSSMTWPRTRVTIAGLTPGKVYWFRVQAFLRSGTTTDPLPAVSLMVV
jgi:hypothetical protein